MNGFALLDVEGTPKIYSKRVSPGAFLISVVALHAEKTEMTIKITPASRVYRHAAARARDIEDRMSTRDRPQSTHLCEHLLCQPSPFRLVERGVKTQQATATLQTVARHLELVHRVHILYV